MRKSLGPTLLLLSWFPGAASAADPASIRDHLQREGALEAGRAVSLANVEAEVGPATLHLDDGLLFPLVRPGLPTAEMVFVGKGRLTLTPPDEIEEEQLELFTASPVLDFSFEGAAFVLTGDDAVKSLLAAGAPAAPGPEAAARAEALRSTWVERPERKLLFVDSALFLDALGETAAESYFAGWFRGGEESGDVVYSVDPDDYEQVTLGQFSPLEVSERDERKIRRLLHSQQQRGRLIGLELEDLGIWDTWVSAYLRDDEGTPAPASSPFEPVHYDLDVALDEDRKMEARAVIRLRSMVEGRRTLRMGLLADLHIQGIAGSHGQPLTFVRSLSDIAVALPAPSVPDEEFTIQVEYEGLPLDKDSMRTFALRSTGAWFPRTGTVDRATYDVTLRYPAKYDLVASGKRIEQVKEGRTIRERRVMEIPTDDFSFELGDFLIKEIEAGDVTITMAFDRKSTTLPAHVREQIQSVARESLEFLSGIFGPYPLDYLTIATAPRHFSQGFLGFVTLSDRAMEGFGRKHIIAHELAHQWWGNMVGWKSYRDQWLSEAMANYAAVLYAREEGGLLGRLFGPLSGWRRQLLSTTEDGRTVESLGPIVLGQRLDSSRYAAAYQAIVYSKGAMVLDTLARRLGEDEFLELLRHLVEAADGRDLSTEEFLASVERMSGINLDGFARQFVYGTGIPEVHYTYRIEKLDGPDWSVIGEAKQVATYRQEYGLVRTPAGFLDVTSRRIDEVDVEESRLVVPFQILAVAGPEEVTAQSGRKGRKAKKKEEATVLLAGKMPVEGASSTFKIDSGRKPLKFWLDRKGEVLALFYSESREPKRVLRNQAGDLAAAGDFEAAEATYRRALEAPVFVAAETEEIMASREKRSARVLDCSIHLLLAELYLDANRDGDAQGSLKEAEKLMDAYIRLASESLLERIRSRLEVRSGEYERTFRRYRRLFKEYWRPHTEDLLLLAIAASETGHEDVRQEALELARRQGADVSLLE